MFCCGDEFVAQGRSWFGMQQFVGWHTMVVAALLLGTLSLFFLSMPVYVVGLGLFIVSLMSLAALGLRVTACSSDNTLHARQSWAVTQDEGLVANSVLVAGIVGYPIFLALAGRRRRLRH